MKISIKVTYTPMYLSIQRISDADGGSRGVRGEITGFSEGSASRLKRYLTSSEAKYVIMGTWTLPEGTPIGADADAFKEQLDRFLIHYLAELKKSVGTENASLCWFLEFTAAGVPHVHVLATGFVHWLTLAVRWCELMGCPGAVETCSKVERIGGGRRDVRRYATKYACKGLGADLRQIADEVGIDHQGMDDLALWRFVVANLKAKGDKRYQKIVPPWVRGFGRFWGVRGKRGTLEAAIRVPYNANGKEKVINFLHILYHNKNFEAHNVRRIQREADMGMVLVPNGSEWNSKQIALINLGMAAIKIRSM